MPTKAPPKKNVAFTTWVSVRSQVDPTKFQVNPTIAPGDFKFSLDGSNYANLNTLPTVVAAGKLIQVSFIAAEANGDELTVMGEDAAGSEWSGITRTFFLTTKPNEDLATQSSVDTVDDFVDTEVGALTTNLATANAALVTIAGYLDTEIASILTKLGTAAGASLAADVAAIYAKVDTEVQAIITSIGTPAAASVSADIAAIYAKVDTEVQSIITEIGAIALPAAERQAIADAFIARAQVGGSNTAPTIGDALAGGLMNIDITSGVLTVKNGAGVVVVTRTVTRAVLDAIIHSE